MKLFLKAAHTVTRTYFSRLTFSSRQETVRLSVPLNVEPTLTIGALKTLLKPHRWIPQKNLLLVHSDKPLHDDSATLKECFVKDMDTLLVSKWQSYPLKVRDIYDDKAFSVPISSCLETLGDVMDKIRLTTGYHPDNQILVYGCIFLKDKGVRLVTLGIVPGKANIVHVTPNLKPEIPSSKNLPAKFVAHLRDLACHTRSHINIFVELHGPHGCTCTSLKVNPTDSIDMLKNEILKTDIYVNNEEPTDDSFTVAWRKSHEIVCGHKLLANGSTTLAEYGIKDHDVIQWCDTRSFNVIVSWASPEFEVDMEPQGIRIEVVCFDTVWNLKEKIQNKTGIPCEKQNLMLYGVTLNNDEWCLLDFGIIPDSQRSDGDVIMLKMKKGFFPRLFAAPF